MNLFYDVVNALTSLYVTNVDRFVMGVNQHYFIPHKKLDNNVILGHMNMKYSIGVFSYPNSSKFICFDVDMGDKGIVFRVINALRSFGFPQEYIYVSSSGGKGYHVEMFFDKPINLKLLHNLYDWVIEEENLDPKKVEFRPTFTQAIKLPLSRHPKTGNICWYLDQQTLSPIEDISYITQIVQMSRDNVQDMISQKLSSFARKDKDLQAKPCFQKKPCFQDFHFAQDEYPFMKGPGTRHNMMKAIAVHERYKGTCQEEIEAKLKEWVSKQNPAFITDSHHDVMEDAASLAAFVWKPTFVIKNNKGIEISRSDINNILSCHAHLQKHVLFLIMLFTKKYCEAHMPLSRMAKFTCKTQQALQKALSSIEERGLIVKKQSPHKATYRDGKFVGECNSYVYTFEGKDDERFNVEWDFKEETFIKAYVKVMVQSVPQEKRKMYFTKKEQEELQTYNGENCN